MLYEHDLYSLFFYLLTLTNSNIYDRNSIFILKLLFLLAQGQNLPRDFTEIMFLHEIVLSFTFWKNCNLHQQRPSNDMV